MIKKMIQLMVIFLAITSLFCGVRKKIRVSGSETMLTMMEIAAHDFQSQDSDYLVDVIGGGSSVGMLELIQNHSDGAITSREPSISELENLDRIGKWEKQVLAYDGLAIIVNEKNSLQKINLKQVRDIFSGKIKNFSQINGPNTEILPIVRNEKSGSLSFFRDYFFNTHHLKSDAGNLGLDFATHTKIIRTNKELIEMVKNNSGAIAFMGMGMTVTDGDGIKSLAYRENAAEEYIIPTPKSVYDRKYKLSRALYLIYFGSNEPMNDFVAYLLSERGQNRIQSAGYLRGTMPEIKVIEKKENP